MMDAFKEALDKPTCYGHCPTKDPNPSHMHDIDCPLHEPVQATDPTCGKACPELPGKTCQLPAGHKGLHSWKATEQDALMKQVEESDRLGGFHSASKESHSSLVEDPDFLALVNETTNPHCGWCDLASMKPECIKSIQATERARIEPELQRLRRERDDARNEVKTAELRGQMEAEARIQRIIEGDSALHRLDRYRLLAAIRGGDDG